MSPAGSADLLKTRLRRSDVALGSCGISKAACLQGGANAGHTVYDDKGTKYALHLVPSGILNQQAQCIVGNGVVVHLPTLFEEMDTLQQQGVSFDGRFLVSDR